MFTTYVYVYLVYFTIAVWRFCASVGFATVKLQGPLSTILFSDSSLLKDLPPRMPD